MIKYFFIGLERHWLYFSRKARFWIFVVLMMLGALVCAGIGEEHFQFLSWMTGMQIQTRPYSPASALALYKGFLLIVFPILFFLSSAWGFPSDIFMVSSLVAGKKPSIMDRLSLFAIFMFCALIALTAGFVVFQLFLSARFSFVFLDLQFKIYLMSALYMVLFCSVSLLFVTLFRNRVLRLIFALIVWISILVFFRYADFAQSPYFTVVREWNFLQVVVLSTVSSLSILCSVIAHQIFQLKSFEIIQ